MFLLCCTGAQGLEFRHQAAELRAKARVAGGTWGLGCNWVLGFGLGGAKGLGLK